MRVIGAGFGRTGTNSLKLGLEQLLGEPCYHMFELVGRPDDVPAWQAAYDGEAVDWRGLFEGWGAAVDWPVASFAPEIAEAHPDAIVVLSTRDPASWWRSADSTIFPLVREQREEPDARPLGRMVDQMLRRDVGDIDDAEIAQRHFVAHNERMREEISADRLVEWQAVDGWQPLCAALDLPVPAEPFPRSNDAADFQSRVDEARRDADR
jgi:hypothetical protein